MLSSQIVFYSLSEDLLDIQQWFKEQEIVCIKPYCYDPECFMANLNAEYIGEFMQVCLTLPKWIEQLEYEECSTPSDSPEYFLDYDKELIIQFGFGKTAKEGLLPANRFYFTKQYYDSTTRTFIKKDEEYIKWAMKIYRDFKKRFLVKYDFGVENFGVYYTTLAVIERFELEKFRLRGY